MHVGNPAIDLALAHVFLPIESHPIFLQAYGPVDEAVWLLAYYRGIFSTVTIMDYAYDTEDKDLLQEAEFSLGLLLESQFC